MYISTKGSTKYLPIIHNLVYRVLQYYLESPTWNNIYSVLVASFFLKLEETFKHDHCFFFISLVAILSHILVCNGHIVLFFSLLLPPFFDVGLIQ